MAPASPRFECSSVARDNVQLLGERILLRLARADAAGTIWSASSEASSSALVSARSASSAAARCAATEGSSAAAAAASTETASISRITLSLVLAVASSRTAASSCSRSASRSDSIDLPFLTAPWSFCLYFSAFSSAAASEGLAGVGRGVGGGGVRHARGCDERTAECGRANLVFSKGLARTQKSVAKSQNERRQVVSVRSVFENARAIGHSRSRVDPVALTRPRRTAPRAHVSPPLSARGPRSSPLSRPARIEI